MNRIFKKSNFSTLYKINLGSILYMGEKYTKV
jgi:hypothetical protein